MPASKIDQHSGAVIYELTASEKKTLEMEDRLQKLEDTNSKLINILSKVDINLLEQLNK